MLLLTLAVAARAQCAEPYTYDAMDASLAVFESAIRTGEIDAANEQLRSISERLPCVAGVVDRQRLATYARWTAMTAFYDQDEGAALRWALASRNADAGLPWPEWIGATHPFRGMATAAEDPPVGVVPNASLAPPKGGGIFLSGHLVLEPRARAEVPVLVQVLDKKGRWVDAFWQDGAAFPDSILAEATGEELEAPRWWTGDAPQLAAAPPPRKPKGDGPNVGALVVAVGTAVAGGALYGLAWMTAESLPEAENADEAAILRTRANALVVASGAAGIASVGATIGVFAGQESAGVGVRVRF